MSAPPLYNEVDYILHQQSKIDLSTFLQESRIEQHHSVDKGLRPFVSPPPRYQCTVSRTGRLYRKLENTTDESGDLHVPFRRSWREFHAVVRGTKLEFYGAGHTQAQDILASTDHEHHSMTKQLSTESTLSSASPSIANSIRSERTMNRSGLKHVKAQNDLLLEYSLLGTVVGIACDYAKRENVLRVRAGKDQFLIQCNGSKDVVEWLEVLQKGANIAAPLDTRVEPNFVGAPRRRRANVRTRNQAYAIYEATSAEAPLRPRVKTMYARGEPGNARSYVRSVVPLNRQLDSAMVQSSRHTHSARHPSMRTTTNTINHNIIPARIFSVFEASRDVIDAHVTAHLSKETNRSSKSSCTEHNRKERYVCAILAADHPRQQLISLPK